MTLQILQDCLLNALTHTKPTSNTTCQLSNETPVMSCLTFSLFLYLILTTSTRVAVACHVMWLCVGNITGNANLGLLLFPVFSID